jgi:hypothetical protein
VSHNSKVKDKSVIWQNTEKYKERKVVTNHLFPISAVGIFLPRTSRYGATLFTSSIVNVTAMLPR